MLTVGSWVNHAEGEGAVVEIAGGAADSYAVRLFDNAELVWARAAELTELGTLPAKNVGDAVTFAGLSGTVTAVSGEQYEVEVTRRLKSGIESTTTFSVPRWMFEVA